MAQYDPLENKLVVLLGGDGFLGTHIAQALFERNSRVRIAARHTEKAWKLKPLAKLGQVQFTRCDVTNRASLEASLMHADAVVYLVGTFGANQKALQADCAGAAAEIAAAQGTQSFVYVSAIGADSSSESGYASSKGLGEELVGKAFPTATIVRPSIIYGQDDNFLNMFAGMISMLPALPVFGPDAKIQPVWVDDAAEAIVNALACPEKHGGKTFELAGPDVITMADLHERIAMAQERRRSFIPVPDSLSALFAALPLTPMSSDQWNLLKAGSIAGGDLPGIEKLGVTAHPLSLFLDRWMVRYRKHGRFAMESA